MRAISIWASQHVWLSRISIIISTLSLAIIAVFLGTIASEEGYLISPVWMWILLIAVFAVCTIYPKKKQLTTYSSYRFRKALDLFLTTASFCLILFFSNLQNASISTFSSSIGMEQANASSTFPKPIHPSVKKQKKMVHQWVKQWKNKFSKATTASQVLLIILTILVAAFLIVLIAGLSCGIACNSSGALAIAVLLLGTTGVVLLARRLIHRIKFGPKPKPVTEPTTT